MRLFWGIELSEPVRASLAGAQAALRVACPDEKVSWVAPERMHVTFKFLGDAAAAEPIVAAVREALPANGPLELTVGGLGSFGGRNPRVLWAGVEGPGLDALAEAARAVDRALRPLGFRVEKRAYTPHVTLGRLRSGRRRGKRGASGFPAALRAVGLPPLPLAVRELVLFESSFGKEAGPPAYTPLARVEFRASDSPGPAPSR